MVLVFHNPLTMLTVKSLGPWAETFDKCLFEASIIPKIIPLFETSNNECEGVSE